jgi:hypothetical protein
MNGQQLISARWREFFTGSLNRRIFSAALTIGVLTFGVKLASMLKEMLVAASFGTGDELDAFVIALMVPTYIINVVAGSFNAALIPVHIDVRSHRPCSSSPPSRLDAGFRDAANFCPGAIVYLPLIKRAKGIFWYSLRYPDWE